MCGIAGFSLAPDEKCAPTRLAAALLKSIEPRGRDATGAAWVAPKTLEVFYRKDAVPASRFIPGLDLAGARTAILHTRFATQGSKANNDNNHPIVLPGMVGIHNGVLHNDDELFKMLGTERIAQVDSEAAFALLNHDDKTPTTERLALLEGSAALAWLTVDDEGLSDRVLHLARVHGSPLWIGQTKAGSTIFGSTRSVLEAAEKELNLRMEFMHQVAEGVYVTVRRGTITMWDEVPVPKRIAQPVVQQPAQQPALKVAGGETKVTPGIGATKAEREAEVARLRRMLTNDTDGYWGWKRLKSERERRMEA